MASGPIPRTPAHAAALSGCAARNDAIAAGSHADRLPEPPYSSGLPDVDPAYNRCVVPDTIRTPLSASTVAVTPAAVPDGGSTGATGRLDATGTNESAPGSVAACSTTVAGAASDRARRTHTTAPTIPATKTTTPTTMSQRVRTVTDESSIRDVVAARRSPESRCVNPVDGVVTGCLPSRMQQRRRPALTPGRRVPSPGVASPEHAVLAMQRAAGNQAVVRALSTPAPAVQRSATTELNTWNEKPVESYEMGLNAMTDDVIGHAWVDVKEVGGKGRRRSIGFWPGSWGWLPTGGPGELMSPDGHDGQQMHRQKETMNRERFLRVLNVVSAWESSWYQLLYRNCAHFAKAAWIAGTGSPDGIVNVSGPQIWTPAETAEGIDYVNKKRGLDSKGNPLPADQRGP